MQIVLKIRIGIDNNCFLEEKCKKCKKTLYNFIVMKYNGDNNLTEVQKNEKIIGNGDVCVSRGYVYRLRKR